MKKPTKLATPTAREKLFTDIQTFLSGYMSFPEPYYALVCALWALGTYTYQSFDAFPYLHITKDTKQSGGTRLGELLAMLSQNAYMMAALTPATLFRMFGEAASEGRGITVFFDESESLSSEAASTMRAVLNVGYRRGQTIPRVVSNKVVQFPIYGPKAFIGIGDVYDTLRDRAIIVYLRRGKPARNFSYGIAQAEAEALKARIAPFANYEGDIVDASNMGGRESEIWTPLFTLASVWCPTRLDELVRAAADMAAAKTAPKRHYTKDAVSESDMQAISFGERALSDLSSVFASDEKFVFTADAIRRLLAIPAAPWRKYQGDGLTPLRLASLLSALPVPVRPKNIRASGSGSKGTGKVAKGYMLADVRNALSQIGV